MDQDKEKQQLIRTYAELPLYQVPWNRSEPSEELVQLIESEQVKPCKALDLGCGLGRNSIYLAKLGFEVTAVDLSPDAITKANRLAVEADVDIDYRAIDLLEDLDGIDEQFEFIIEWNVLHHIYPQNRKKYAQAVEKLLAKDGKYLSVCFSEDNTNFGGEGKYRETKLSTQIYFSSEQEIRELFDPHFKILELKTISVQGSPNPHRVVWAMLGG